MNELLKLFLKEAQVDQTAITKLTAEGTTEAEAKTLAAKFLEKRKSHFEGTVLKEAVKIAEEKAFSGAILKVSKKFNQELGLGLTNKDINTFVESGDLDGFAKKSSEIIDESKQKLREDADKETIKELGEIKALYKKVQLENSTITEDAENRVKAAQEKAKIELETELGTLARLRAVPKNVDYSIAGAQLAVEGLTAKLEKKAKVGRDGKLTSKTSDTPFIYGETTYETAEEFYTEELTKAGLMPSHNGGKKSDAVKKREAQGGGNGQKEESAELKKKREEFNAKSKSGRSYATPTEATGGRYAE